MAELRPHPDPQGAAMGFGGMGALAPELCVPPRSGLPEPRGGEARQAGTKGEQEGRLHGKRGAQGHRRTGQKEKSAE